MKNYKYIGLFLLTLGFISCDVNNDLDTIQEEIAAEVQLNVNGLDFSKYVSIGASFTAGFTDGALFKAAQENSFPNILAKKFGTDFNQPLMNDNIGGLLYSGNVIQGPRLFFNGAGPESLTAMPTTEVTSSVSGNLNNFGIPGAKSFHLLAPGYGNSAGVIPGLANPYFARMASSSSATVLGDAMAQAPTFFTLSEIGGNDVLGYALSGGSGVDQSPSAINPTGNLDPATYGSNDITNPLVFANVFNGMVATLTSGGAKGVVANLPYITTLAHFTTVPYNPLDPNDAETGPTLKAQIPLLNSVFGAVNQIYVGAGEPERSIVFSTTETNPVVVYDEDATDLTVAIATALGASPTFVPFVESLGLPAAAAPLVAGLLGQQYGKARSATSNDLFVLPSSTVIGKVNMTAAGTLITQSGGLLPATLAGQFSAEGITLPLADKWVLTPQEQLAIKTATDAYNTVIEDAVASNDNIAMVDFKGILQEASTGVVFDGYTMTTSLVTGGLVSLDGVHLTARGYALMANKILAAMDTKFGSNFTTATNGLAKAGDFPTNYSPLLQ
ncbi:SGNH/GDSL hydrolase family protein [Polaribacter atrinae]|uniref:G-D-S-L family lipolytic protein n=1 Tax=Polaribacter atrinae TaxID=1333662 RepID=A0A176TFI8_9FLAO|nr:G-D-S-L family lipolytic protein [Polaribacter atrinae]OAD46411.1 G-D-S-L family lipolytic protein [Polaribacter atrinae]